MSKNKVSYEKKVEIVRDYLDGRVGYKESIQRANNSAAYTDTGPRADTSCIEWSTAGQGATAAAARGNAAANILLDCAS